MLLLILLSLSNLVYAADINLDIIGSGSDVYIRQVDGSKTVDIDIDGDYMNLDIIQKDSGSHNLDLTMIGDYSEATIVQEGSGTHSGTITIDSDTGPMDFTLNQQGTTNKTFTGTSTCYTVAGCSVTYTQND